MKKNIYTTPQIMVMEMAPGRRFMLPVGSNLGISDEERDEGLVRAEQNSWNDIWEPPEGDDEETETGGYWQ